MSEPEIKPVQTPDRPVIPDCCREVWADCPHVIKTAEERVKRNIAL